MKKYLVEKLKALRQFFVSRSIDTTVKCSWCGKPIKSMDGATTNMLNEQYHDKCWLDFQWEP